MANNQGIEKLEQFLAKTRNGLSGTGPIHCVMGNEAADLDSMAAALLYAYGKAVADDQTCWLPLINIPREDYKLRTEAVYLFELAGIRAASLFFAEDVDLAALHQAGRLQLSLIDHNKLGTRQAAYTDTVKSIIDHHADEGLYPDARPRIIEAVGSCATLIADILLNQAGIQLDTAAATLLLGTILLDTVNLDPEAKRTTPKDLAIVNRLLTLTGADRTALFDKLQKEKFNVAALSSADLLRKDYKEWRMGSSLVGVSSVLFSVSDWLKKDSSLAASLGAYATSRKLDVLIAMNAYTEPQFSRELVIYCPDQAKRQALLNFLTTADLGLEPLAAEQNEPAMKLFSQSNLAYSRKKLQPILEGFFSSPG